MNAGFPITCRSVGDAEALIIPKNRRGQYIAVDPVEARGDLPRRDRRSGSKSPDELQPLRMGHRATGKKRQTRARVADNPEAGETKVVGLRQHIRGPVSRPAVRLEIRAPKAGAVNGNQPQAVCAGSGIGKPCLKTAAGRAVKKGRKPPPVPPSQKDKDPLSEAREGWFRWASAKHKIRSERRNVRHAVILSHGSRGSASRTGLKRAEGL